MRPTRSNEAVIAGAIQGRAVMADLVVLVLCGVVALGLVIGLVVGTYRF
jgi:hypothetical protein